MDARQTDRPLRTARRPLLLTMRYRHSVTDTRDPTGRRYADSRCFLLVKAPCVSAEDAFGCHDIDLADCFHVKSGVKSSEE